MALARFQFHPPLAPVYAGGSQCGALGSTLRSSLYPTLTCKCVQIYLHMCMHTYIPSFAIQNYLSSYSFIYLVVGLVKFAYNSTVSKALQTSRGCINKKQTSKLINVNTSFGCLYMYMLMYGHMYMYMYMCLYMYMCMYMCMHACMCIYIYMYLYTI